MALIAFYTIFNVATDNKGYDPSGLDRVLFCEGYRMHSSQSS